MEADRNKKALLISFYFPPNNTIGAVRIGKFAKYLPEFGWEPLVLTARNVHGLTKSLPVEIDESKIMRTSSYVIMELLSRITNKHHLDDKNGASQQNFPASGSILSKLSYLWGPIARLPVMDKLISHPVGWYRPAVKAGLEIIKTNDIKVIFSSYGPSVPHFIAARLHRETGIPWVADYRDNWIDEYKKHPQPFHYFDQQWEKHTLKECAAIVSHNQPLAAILHKSHGKIPTIIPNGFDDADFKDNIALTPKFTITYTGSIYPGIRDPSPVFEALSEATQEGNITPQDIEIRFYGQNVNEAILPLIQKYRIENFVVLGGDIPYRESIQKQTESSICLLLSWNDPKDAGTLTGKIYEYLGANRPILALAYPGGEIDKLLRKSGCGIVSNKPEEIKRLILVWIDEFKKTGRIKTYYHPENNIINSFTRKQQTRALANVFNKVSI